MKVVERPEEVEGGAGGAVLAAGFFDGVHVGHRAILKEARERARHLFQRARCEEARQLLRETLARQTAETLEFLTKLQ